MSKRIFVAAIVLLCACASTPSVSANQPVVAVGSIAKSLAKFLTKEGSEEAAEYMARKGSKELVDRVTASATREGGDAFLDQVAKQVGRHGPDALKAFDNSPQVGPLLRALDEIPEAQAKTAISKLAAGTTGRELADTIVKHGSKALTSELKHPGVGMTLVRALGDDGAELATKMTSDQAITLGKHVDDVAKLPAAQRQGLLTMFKQDTDRMVGFVGDFVKANPGKTLFTVAGTTVILAEPEAILGGDEIAFDAEGNPIVISKKGIVGRSIEAGGEAAKHVSDGYIKPVYYTAGAFIGTFFVVWLMIKLWHAHKREKLKTQQMLDEQAKTVDAKASDAATGSANTIATASNQDAV